MSGVVTSLTGQLFLTTLCRQTKTMARSSSRKKNKPNSVEECNAMDTTNCDKKASAKQEFSESITDEIDPDGKQSLLMTDEDIGARDTNENKDCSPMKCLEPVPSTSLSKSPTAAVTDSKKQDKDETPTRTEASANITSPDEKESDPTNMPVQDNTNQAESPTTEDEMDDDEEEEQWELSHVFTIEELCQTEPPPQICMTKKCPLLACVSYVSSVDKDSIWHSCIDCQEKDYGGWPENVNEIPMKFITNEHRSIMIEKCTGQYAPIMPNIPVDENGNFDERRKEETNTDVDTACLADDHEFSKVDANPDTSCNNDSAHDVAGDTSRLQEETTRANSSPLPTSLDIKEKHAKSFVTPSPAPLSNKTKGLSKAAIANHEKWRNECLKLGGTGKICVKKPEIKKMTFELCKDRFAPMNITQIYHVSATCYDSLLSFVHQCQNSPVHVIIFNRNSRDLFHRYYSSRA